jgi:pimeloyl-ACP methyl ester carboxylesterase
MPRADPTTDDRPTLFCLHFLGGSAQSWTQVVQRLDPYAHCVLIDLPGFGNAAEVPGHAVVEMVETVTNVIRAEAPRRWLLAGHSMGCKVAAVLARNAEDGAEGLGGLEGLVLVSGSPPSPEPMGDDRRQMMLGWFAGGDETSRDEATQFIQGASGKPLGTEAHERAVGDVLRVNPKAWRAWLETGSREDWSDYVGVLRTPALIIAGTDDADLGPQAQQSLMARHFADFRLVVMPDAGHLLPLEWPDRLARLIEDHIRRAATEPSSDASYGAFIRSDRVSSRTRGLLLARSKPDDPAYRPAAIGVDQLATLRAVLDRVLPQTGMVIDLAARIDTNLAAGVSDGWRFAALPPDTEAYRAALRTLDAAAGGAFATLDAAAQDELLGRIAAGSLEIAGPGLLSGSQLKLWFEDLRSDAVRL